VASVLGREVRPGEGLVDGLVPVDSIGHVE
jgi:hypothetical protein